MQRILYWNKFSRPQVTPRTGTSVDYWWFDEAKAAQLAKDRKRESGDAKNEQGGSLSLTRVLSAIIILGVALFFLARRARRKREAK